MLKKLKFEEKDSIEKRLNCLILLNCLKDSSEKEKLKIVANCIGITETAKILGKDPSNFSKHLNDKWTKKVSQK